MLLYGRITKGGENILKIIHMIAFILLVIGGLNWGLVGIFHLNLVEKILGSIPVLQNTVYILVGLSAIWEVATHKHNCKTCSMPAAAKTM